jgi:hypothetical protein
MDLKGGITATMSRIIIMSIAGFPQSGSSGENQVAAEKCKGGRYDSIWICQGS